MSVYISRGTALALCLSQLAVTVGVILYFPPVRIEFYNSQPTIVNGTVDPAKPPTLLHTGISLSMPLLLCSCLAAIFSTVTAGLVERGVLQQDNFYTTDVLNDAGMWDLIFWFYCTLAHSILISVVMSPANAFAAALASILYIYFLACICQPRQTQLSMTQTNINLLGLWSGLLIATYNLPDTHTGRVASLFIMCVLDYMLGVGHTWDVSPTMDTVTNCRLFWVCSCSFCLAGLYGAWHDHFLIES